MTIQPGGSYGSGEVWLLQAPNNDVSLTEGETLGGSAIGDDASWTGTPIPVTSSGGNFLLTLSPATAAVLKLTAGTGSLPPTGLKATAGNGQVSLSWTASTGVSSYNVKRTTTSGLNYALVKSGVTATSFTDTTVTNGTTYFYVVSAQNANGESPNSSEVSAKPGPLMVIAINAGGQAVGAFVADWVTPIIGATGWDAGVLEAAGDLGLGEEPARDRLVPPEPLADHFDRHIPAKRDVASFKNGAGAPLHDQFAEVVVLARVA